jgi:energy-coupling factor transporter ATP-binding protein EcfA2
MMSLFDNILSWASAELKDWQRDALRRLVQKQELAPQDIEDLYAMLKSAHGLSDPKNRRPVPLAKEHLPAQMGGASPVILLALRDLKHVNRIAPGQKLDFAPKGITVIYGGNASGKSGYSRVLKRACRARDLSETIHPDASDAKAAANLPEATFDIEVGGNAIPLTWKRDETPPDGLSTISVFDCRCARAYLDTEQDAAYLPYGLDIVENLGQRVLPALTKSLNAEIEAINTDATPFADLLGDTNVGKTIASLSAISDPQKITDLATLMNAEITRLTELDKTLAESDPRAKSKALRLSAQRIDGLISRIDTAITWVNDAAVEKLKACDVEAEKASDAEVVAAAGFRADELLLPGTGEQTWKSLFEAARRFSTEIAYPDKPFPHVDADARCPLCQQPFAQEAANRMRRFENFVKQDTARVATEKRRQCEDKTHNLKASSLSFGLDAAITEEIKQLDPILLQAIQDFEKGIEARKVWVLGAVEAHVWNTPPLLAGDPRTSLKTLSANFVAQAADLDKATDEKQKKALEAERSELQARANLSPRLKAMLDLIGRMQVKAKLTKCKDDLKTKAISDKAREFASQAVTTALKNALNTEFQALGVDRIKIKLNERVEQGKMKHKLVLDLPVTKKLDEILSEGEQRAIAIGSFLAELHLAGHQGGIVFDDPVSSLDHHWRKNVARRLVEEAKNRQVIVLTHDTAFLGELRDAIDQQRVNHLMHHLEWMNGSPGYVAEGLPWEHQSYKERLDKHEKAQMALEKTWPSYPNANDRDGMRHEYDLLRATIERVIQDVVFNGVVQRYRDWIRVDRLADVAGVTGAEYKEISRLHKACSDVVDAHDPSSAKNASVPDAKQLGKDIEALKTVIEGIKARRKQGANTKAPAIP